jgi:hypothetical protein
MNRFPNLKFLKWTAPGTPPSLLYEFVRSNSPAQKSSVSKMFSQKGCCGVCCIGRGLL